MTAEIKLALTDEEIAACSPVMRQLRTHIIESEFLARVKLQQRGGYQLCYLTDGGMVRSVAGFRVIENLASGRVLYVDDLVSDCESRSKGYGEKVLLWLIGQARSAHCDTLELDSGVQRHGAHRFYLRNRMDIVSHHFRMNLK
jgi:GNAT superfamily N-acetyltransferase